MRIARKITLAMAMTLLLLGCGCAQMERAIYRPGSFPAEAATGVDSAGVVVDEGPVVSHDLGAASPGGTVPLLESRRGTEAAIEAVKLLPLPFASMIGTTLGWAYTAYRNHRNRRAIFALVSGIESIRDRHLRQHPLIDQEVVKNLRAEQRLHGVHDVVARVLSRMVKE